jgi:hypothetical protein
MRCGHRVERHLWLAVDTGDGVVIVSAAVVEADEKRIWQTLGALRAVAEEEDVVRSDALVHEPTDVKPVHGGAQLPSELDAHLQRRWRDTVPGCRRAGEEPEERAGSAVRGGTRGQREHEPRRASSVM